MKRFLSFAGLVGLVAGVFWVMGPGLQENSDTLNGKPGSLGTTSLASPAWADPPIPDCPAIFAICEDTFGRNCNFSPMCTTSDTGEKKCKKPDGSTFMCQGSQTIRVQNCPCREVFHMTCCDDKTCGPCPLCESQPGSQNYFCL